MSFAPGSHLNNIRAITAIMEKSSWTPSIASSILPLEHPKRIINQNVPETHKPSIVSRVMRKGLPALRPAQWEMIAKCHRRVTNDAINKTLRKRKQKTRRPVAKRALSATKGSINVWSGRLFKLIVNVSVWHPARPRGFERPKKEPTHGLLITNFGWD